MSQRDSGSVLRAVLEQLGARRLMAGGQLLGNAGQIFASQYQPSGFVTKVGVQLLNVSLGGPIHIQPIGNPSNATSIADAGIVGYPVNSGLIALSQFNTGGFRTVGVQLDGVAIGGGLTVAGSDDDANSGTSTFPLTVTNSNLISSSQFNDGGFGILTGTSFDDLVPIHSRVGLQWRNVAVKGSVAVGLDDETIGSAGLVPPIGFTAAAANPTVSASAVASSAGRKIIDFTTNSGRISNSQFNDGGFGDIGVQWSNVAVGGGVGTSSNALFINPQQDNTGAISVVGRSFGAPPLPAASASVAAASVATPSAAAMGSAAVSVAAATSTGASDFQTTYDNSATNSGTIDNSQVNAGAFGDVGMQWDGVIVKGTVSAVHNSLAVQPQNKGQGLIMVNNVQFPSVAPTSPTPTATPTPVPDAPAVVANDGVLAAALPAPTGPISPFFPVPFSSPGTVTLGYPANTLFENAANNSGLIKDAQYNAGGFGDTGLQWKQVQVDGNVTVVHNSLSVHPEGSQFAGATVSSVAYGAPVSKALAKRLVTLRYLKLTPANNNASTPGTVPSLGVTVRPPNDRVRTDQQLAKTGGTDVVLQWNGIEHRKGLVVVDNVIKIQGVGPLTGPITLSNIRFPFRLPNTRPRVMVVPESAASTTTAASAAAAVEPGLATLLNDSVNSGIIKGGQFSTGGFGDDGLQWNNVEVAGNVNVVHNQLAIDESTDLPVGDVSGPITVSNITFNRGALEPGASTKGSQVVVAPPAYAQIASTHKVNPGTALPQDKSVREETTNSGILNGGQLAGGAARQALLQWQCVKVDGEVTVVENVLTISVQDKPTGPILISNVTFA